MTNDTFHALRAFTRTRAPRDSSARSTSARRRRHEPLARSDRGASRRRRPRDDGRWCEPRPPTTDATKWSAAIAQQLLARHGVVTREGVAAESIPGGFGSVYPVLKAMEETGRVRRGYFVAGLGATQFSLPGALDLLRSLRDAGRKRHARGRRPRGDRSGEPVRRDAQMALTTITAELAEPAEQARLCELSGFCVERRGVAMRPAAGRRARSARR